jgi:adenylate cyclase
MAQESLISQINDWLVDQALGEPDIVEMFNSACQRLAAIGIPVSRARLTWPTLHPLFRAETVLWRRGAIAEFEQFNHQDSVTEEWLRSPMHFMMEADVTVFRRRMEGPDKLIDFDVVQELADQGYTDYLVIRTTFSQPGMFADPRRRGIFLTWATDREGGFSDSDLGTLQRLQRRFAVCCKTAIQSRIARNITQTYLGHHAGDQVLQGSIRLGDGQETKALVWYSDLRSSTHLAETMPSADFISLLNVYFECAARPAIEAGGEVLAFIGDAVLAIFPFAETDEIPDLAGKIFDATRRSLARADQVNLERRNAGLEPIRFGLALNVGSVMFGNIGVPERLAFSAIGPTVIEVARMEKLTKVIGARVLTTRDIATVEPGLWRSLGEHPLEGVGQPVELFSFREDAAAQAA